MTDKIPVSDQKTPASGDPEGNTPVEDGQKPQDKDTVAYETYRRVVGESKKAKSRAKELETELQAYKDAEKRKEEEDLEKRGEYDKVKASLQEELDKAKAENKALKQEHTDNRKLGAFLSSLDGTVAKEYWPLINIDQIAVDPDTNEIDELSVKRLVDTFKSTHSRLIDGVKGPRMTDSSPDRQSVLTTEEWRKLPLKERKERMGEVYRQSLET
jgi:hypothetical protein